MKKAIVALLVIILLATLGLGGYAIWKLNDKMDEQNNKVLTMINEIKDDSSKNVTNQNVANNNVVSNTTNNVATQTTTNTTANTTTNQGTSNASLEEQIKTAFLNQLAGNYKLTGYRVDDVEILSDELTRNIIEEDNGQYYKNGDVLARVTYAVTPAEAGMAGNGIQSGDWIINKTACVCYRDGIIVSSGTSF